MRERYYAVDTCPAETGGWHDWMWFHFDEMSGTVDEFKISQNKDMPLYLTKEEKYFPAGDFDIRHYDRAYLASSGVFIPSRYEVSIETEAGVLDMNASAVSAYAASGIRDVPDSPTIILDWDKLDGIFTYKDGRKKTLTNGLGGTLIRQWRPYPSSLLTGANLKADDAPTYLVREMVRRWCRSGGPSARARLRPFLRSPTGAALAAARRPGTGRRPRCRLR